MLTLGVNQEAAALRDTTAQNPGPGGGVGGTAPRGGCSPDFGEEERKKCTLGK